MSEHVSNPDKLPVESDETGGSRSLDPIVRHCPFCGHAPTVKHWEQGQREWHAIHCMTPGCFMECMGIYDGDDDCWDTMLKKWNTRIGDWHKEQWQESEAKLAEAVKACEHWIQVARDHGADILPNAEVSRSGPEKNL